jgi:uncharacterized protein YfaS (alpha-2-macroglobulin family)
MPLALILTLALFGCPKTQPRTGDVPADSPTGPAVGEPMETGAEDRARLLGERAGERKAAIEELRAKLKKESAEALFGRGEEMAKAQNWKDAAEAYTALVVHYPEEKRAAKATIGAMTARFANGQYTEGLLIAEAGVDLVQDSLRRARLQRVVGNAYLALPHWGTEAGGELLRGQWAQGKQTHTFRRDRVRAIEHLEAARDALAEQLAQGKVKLDERVDAQLDLVTAVARFTPYDANWSHWWYAWAESADDDRVEEEGADERAGRWSWSWYDQLAQVRPRGLPVTEKGEVVFTQRPEAYAPDLDDTQKIKFLLHEVERIDQTAEKERAAQALMLRGLLFRARDGAERLQRLGQWWYRGSRPFQKDVEGKSLHTLGDDQALGLVATHLAVYDLPKDESFVSIMGDLRARYPKTKAADRAGFLLGQFFQSRAQYDKAIAAYEDHQRTHPKGDWRSASESAVDELRRPEVAFVEMGVQPAGRPAVLNVKFRNLDEVRVDARRVDLEKLLKDFKGQYRNGRTTKGWSNEVPRPSDVGWALFHDQHGALGRYATKKAPSFTAALKPDPSGRYADAALTSKLTKPGLYVIEAYPKGKTKDGDRLARGLVLVESIALVQKPTTEGTLFWAVDARTGAPKAGASVEVFEYWNNWQSNSVQYYSKATREKTDDDGIAIARPTRQFVAIARRGDEVSVTGFGYGWGRYSRSRPSSERVALVQSDRPVYRPGDEIQLKVWARVKDAGVYKPASSVGKVRVRVYNPQGETALDKTLKANEFGAVDLKLPLGAMAPLGAYRVNVEVDGGWARANESFRVEEYKAPEFTVSVESASEARLGEKVPVKVKAEYLFGGAVVDAKVRYKVYRQDYRHEYVVPARWDWLYGPGYGRCYYIYDWFDWWGYAPAPVVWYPWWGPPPEPAKELVLEGEGRIDDKGELTIEVDTGPAKRDFGETDHKYLVKAEVTDLSRRLIKGEGSVLVTRAGYFAHVELDRGWYRSGDELGVHVATQRPDGELFGTKGELVIERVLYIGDGGQTVEEKVVDRIPVKTRAEAPVRFTWRAPKTGQYKVSFVGKDQRGAEVKASSVAWVAGPGFHGRAYRFQGLEVRTDQRTYKVGDTAKLMINTKRTGAHVLLATRAERGYLLDKRVIKLDGRSTVVEIEIAEGDAPNFFVEALTVDDGELLTEIREVFVPPMNTELNVEVKSDKSRYGPGEKVTLKVKTTDQDGKPRPAEVALSVFDSAVLYIQPELIPAARAYFWSQRRGHSRGGTSNLSIKYTFGDQLRHPDRRASWSLVSAQNEFAQTETDFRYRDGSLRGADELEEEDADAPRQQAAGDAAGSGGLGLRGTGRGGGGKAKRKAVGSVNKDKNEPMTPEASLASANKAPAAEKKEQRARGAKQPDDDAESNAQQGATATSIRRNFADTAHFSPVVRTGADGTASVSFTLPDNLTTWRVKAVGLDGDTRAGDASHSFVSTKELLVRLQAPRFFRERDRVVLSAVVRNATKKKRKVNVQLRVSEDLLVPEGDVKRSVEVPAEGDARVDFWVKVRGEGRAKVRMDVVSGDLSDAKEMSFPVLVHGLVKTISKVGSVPMGDGAAEKSIALSIPKDRRPELTTLHVRFSPSLAGGMLDALPYLLDYPYGCTEQTLSRFVPAVLTRKTLQQSGGLKLEDLKGATNLNPQQLTKDGKEEKQRSDHDHRVFDRNPVFDSAKMDDMIAAGVRRLRRFQNGDGGWGWWGSDGSSLYTTAHVVDGLLDAQFADVRLPSGMLGRGQQALQQLVAQRVSRTRDHPEWVSNEDAFAAWVMARSGQKNDEMLKRLFEHRRTLSAYGKLYAALAHHKVGNKKRGYTLLENAEQLLKVDDENETAWLETQQQGWWYWWNNDVETNATWLLALDEMGKGDKRRSELAPRVIKWLLNHRQNGYYWRSTRDTARVIAAFANHMQKSGERAPEMDVEVLLDGKVVRTVHIDRHNMLTFDGEIVLEGEALTTGDHELTFRKKGKGALYMNAYLSYFSTEEDVEAAGLEVKVERSYYKLVRDDRVRKVQGDRGQRVRSRQVAYRKVPLKSGERVKSGDLILVELMLESKNDYTFLAFEDPKPAGMEAVALRSGTTYGEAVANMELRDERVVFFLRRLDRGKRKLSYRLRAEIPGEFHAMPTFGFGMYAPELRTNSSEMRVVIDDE